MRSIVYCLIFLLTLHSTLTIYTNSSFLSELVRQDHLGYIYVGSAVLSLLALLFGHRIGASIGNLRLALGSGILQALGLIGMSLSGTVWVIILSFCVSQASIALLFYSFDVFLESYTRNSSTGGVRGTYLTVINSAFLIGPIVGTQVLSHIGYTGVYSLAACLLLFVMLATVILLNKFEDPEYTHGSLAAAIAAFKTKPAVVYVTMTFAALCMFYVVAIVYMPLFYTQILGFTAVELGYLLAIGLLPFVIVQVPLGKLADKDFGEKEFLLAGFFLMAATSFLVPYVATLGFVALAMLTFVGRIGAASTEVMNDSYFFKHVSAGNIGAITTYRSMMYAAYIIVPIVVGPIFLRYGYAIAAPVAGAFALLGIIPGILLKDTK